MIFIANDVYRRIRESIKHGVKRVVDTSLFPIID